MSIKIKWLSDDADAIRGNKAIKESLEDIVDESDDVAKAFKDAAKDAGWSAERIEDSLEEVARQANTTGKKIGTELDDGFDKAKRGADDFKQEAGQSGREAAASFSGGFDDVADFVQETLANAFGGFGPVGAAAGIALAAIVGTVLSNAQTTQQTLEEARSRAVEIAQAMYENNGTLPLTDRVTELFETLAKERTSRNVFEKLAGDFVDLGTNIDQTREAARAADVPIERLLKSLTGTDIRETKDTIEAINAELERMNEESGTVNLADFTARQGALQGMRTELEKVVNESELANDLYSSTDFLSRKRIDDLAAGWENAAVQVSNYFTTAEDGATTFDAAAYVAAFEEELAKVAEVKADLVGLPESVREEALRQFAEGGVAAADAYIDAYQSADPGTRAKLNEIAGQQGAEAGQTQGAALAEAADAAARAAAQGWGPLPVTAKVTVDSSEIDNTIQRLRNTQLRIAGRITASAPGLDRWE